MLKWCWVLCLCSAQAAEIYSWRDKDGVMHFGEKPPENAQDLKKKIIADAPPNNTGERDHIGDSQKLLRAFDEERAEKNQQKAQQKAEQLQREKNCAQAKENYAIFQSSSRQFVKQKDGSERDLSPAEVRANDEYMRGLISKWCD